MKMTFIIASVLAAMLTLASCGNVNDNAPAERIASAAHTNDVVNEAPADLETAETSKPEESAPQESSAAEPESTAEAAARGKNEDTAADSASPKADNTVAEVKADENVSTAVTEAPVQQAAPESQAPDLATGTDQDSGNDVDMDDLRLQLKDSIDALNTQTAIAKGEYADTTVWYDEDFNVTDDRDKLAYYPIPEEYREQCLAFDMVMYSGHFTGGFISSMGLDISDRIVEHEGALYFKADKYTAHRPTYYVLLNDEIHMNGNDSFHVEVTDGQGVYDLSFVYETCITVYDHLWKMDTMTYERTYN